MSVQSKALRQIADDVPRYPDYQPLAHDSREIRLLDLGPDFKYTLRHVSLDDKPCYVALSYYRGAPGTTKPIWVNGFEIQLRKTVYQFLKSLFRQFGSITVWLDVICINQRDVQEQGSQVSMMGEIYGTANCVCCWLGAGSADTDYALRRLAVPGSINTPMERRSKKIRTSSEDIGLTVEGAELRHVYAGLEHIFSQPYWARSDILDFLEERHAYVTQIMDYPRVRVKSDRVHSVRFIDSCLGCAFRIHEHKLPLVVQRFRLRLSRKSRAPGAHESHRF